MVRNNTELWVSKESKKKNENIQNCALLLRLDVIYVLLESKIAIDVIIAAP